MSRKIEPEGGRGQGAESAQDLLLWLKDNAAYFTNDELRAAAIKQGAIETSVGQLAVEDTGDNKGRNPHARFIVDNQTGHEAHPISWGKENKAAEAEKFTVLQRDILAHLVGQEIIYGGEHSVIPQGFEVKPYRIHFFGESAFHRLFADNMFREEVTGDVEGEITILHAPSFEADPDRHGTAGKEGIFIDLKRRTVLICGTHYAGEIKKAVFTILNYELPAKGILPLHCSVGVDEEGNSAVFLGLSGTGKTTLSALMPFLVGDDEHAWGDKSITNFEGGSYAKVNRLSKKDEPQIYHATEQRGTLLENVVISGENKHALYHYPGNHPNARSSYGLEALENVVESGMADHPTNIFLLSYDAFGVLPPISKLTSEQAVNFFLSGYTSKVAGTEKSEGGDNSPKITFSAGFGAPFLPLHPMVYAGMFREKIQQHGASVWMINTGFASKPDNKGQAPRVELEHTKALVQAAIRGDFDDVEMEEAIAGLEIPTVAPEGVSVEVLNPRNNWDEEEYDLQADKLQAEFAANWAEKYGD